MSEKTTEEQGWTLTKRTVMTSLIRLDTDNNNLCMHDFIFCCTWTIPDGGDRTCRSQQLNSYSPRISEIYCRRRKSSTGDGRSTLSLCRENTRKVDQTPTVSPRSGCRCLGKMYTKICVPGKGLVVFEYRAKSDCVHRSA